MPWDRASASLSVESRLVGNRSILPLVLHNLSSDFFRSFVCIQSGRDDLGGRKCRRILKHNNAKYKF